MSGKHRFTKSYHFIYEQTYHVFPLFKTALILLQTMTTIINEAIKWNRKNQFRGFYLKSQKRLTSFWSAYHKSRARCKYVTDSKCIENATQSSSSSIRPWPYFALNSLFFFLQKSTHFLSFTPTTFVIGASQWEPKKNLSFQFHFIYLTWERKIGW